MNELIFPTFFDEPKANPAVQEYEKDMTARKLADFFRKKGVAQLKEEDDQGNWYEDWIQYQGRHRIYSSLLAPARYSSFGCHFDLLKIARLLEIFSYFSPAHAYSLQVSFLGIFPILMSGNESLQKEAISALEKGGLFAFGVSEQEHGSDLYSNSFRVTPEKNGFRGHGSKYYIGNSNAASMISILGRLPEKKLPPGSARSGEARSGEARSKDEFIFFALRPESSKGFKKAKKIPTLGVRTAFVGGFEVQEHSFPQEDVISVGNRAWDAIFGTVNIGKFFLGYGSVGICQHALSEARKHLQSRVLYGKPVIQMPHIELLIIQAWIRLLAMKLYAYRAIDYLQTAKIHDRRYLLFNSVQKAKVSTQGVQVMETLCECVGARGFERVTYFECALRDAQMIPGLEGSTHINYGLTLQFLRGYFFNSDSSIPVPASLIQGTTERSENEYLFKAQTGGASQVRFAPYLRAFENIRSVSNVQILIGQVKAFRLFLISYFAENKLRQTLGGSAQAEAEAAMALGKCFSTIVYAQLIAENAKITEIPHEAISLIFQQMIEDLSENALALGTIVGSAIQRRLLDRVIAFPRAVKNDLVWARKKMGLC